MTSALDGRRGRSSSPSSSSSSPVSAGGNSTGFIRASCGVTLYPRLCYASRAAYADSVAENPSRARASPRTSPSPSSEPSARTSRPSSAAAPLLRRPAVLRDCCEYATDLPAAPGLSSRTSSPVPSSTPATPRGGGKWEKGERERASWRMRVEREAAVVGEGERAGGGGWREKQLWLGEGGLARA